MSDEFDDSILIEDDGSGGGSSRPFLLAAGALVGILLLSLLCLAAFNALGGGDGDPNGEEVAQVDDGSAATATSISATNEAIATANSFVTQTIESITLTAGAPTATPTDTPMPPTNTPTATATETPTETPVVENGDGSATPETGEDPNAAATSIFQGLNTATPTVSSGGTAPTVTPPATSLPQTGISLWNGILAVLGLIVVIVVVRRVRAS